MVLSPTAWEAVLHGFVTPSPDGFLPNVEIVDDRASEGMRAESVLAGLPAGDRSVVFIADQVTAENSELLLQAVRPAISPLQSFRLNPADAWSVESNLTLANMDWEDS